MGRHACWVALSSGMAAGSQLTLVPEEPFDVAQVCAMIKARFQRGDKSFICVVAEGAHPAPDSGFTLREGGIGEFGHERFTGVAQQLGSEIERRIGKEVRTTRSEEHTSELQSLMRTSNDVFRLKQQNNNTFTYHI